MVTTIEVIDTAVKIGLGALISGAAAYWIAKLNHDRDVAKEQARRRRELLESVAEQVEKFSHIALKYWAYINGVARNEREGQPMTEASYNPVLEVRAELFNMFGEVTSAEAKLLLLGEKKCQRLLRDYGEVVKVMREESVVKNPKFTEEYLKQERSKVLNSREAFFDELSAVYKQKRI